MRRSRLKRTRSYAVKYKSRVKITRKSRNERRENFDTKHVLIQFVDLKYDNYTERSCKDHRSIFHRKGRVVQPASPLDRFVNCA